MQASVPGVVRPGRPLTERELRRLRSLLLGRERAEVNARWFVDEVEDFVLDCRDDGCSARGIADALGVSSATVHAWTHNAKRRRDM